MKQRVHLHIYNLMAVHTDALEEFDILDMFNPLKLASNSYYCPFISTGLIGGHRIFSTCPSARRATPSGSHCFAILLARPLSVPHYHAKLLNSILIQLWLKSAATSRPSN
ncbi:hypothetical protein J6590_019572 [Homalodisca vitripennis]|nr:hypothetical protein J6590_019572 [Homalodisca vitripennis]